MPVLGVRTSRLDDRGASGAIPRGPEPGLEPYGIRVDGEGLLELAHGLLQPALFAQNIADAHVRFTGLRLDAQGLLILVHGLVSPAFGVKGVAEIDADNDGLR